MNCAKSEHCLLSCERPEQPPTEVRRHLAQCPACRALQRRLVEVEQHLPRLPVPPAPGRAAFLARVRAGDIPAAGPADTSPKRQRGDGPVAGAPGSCHRPAGSLPHTLKERALRKVALAFALAAALAAFALGWWAWPHDSDPAGRSPIAARQQQRDRLLAQAHTPRERVEVLAGLADRLQREARQLTLPTDGDQLRVVARFYREVVHDNLLEHARQLPPDERPAVLGTVAEQLNGVDSEVQRLLTNQVPDSSKESLRDIALASRESHDLLRALLRT